MQTNSLIRKHNIASSPKFGRQRLNPDKTIYAYSKSNSLKKWLMPTLGLGILGGSAVAFTTSNFHQEAVKPQAAKGMTDYLGHMAAGVVALPLAFLGLRSLPNAATKSLNTGNSVSKPGSWSSNQIHAAFLAGPILTGAAVTAHACLKLAKHLGKLVIEYH
jgi:hypothetical protein